MNSQDFRQETLQASALLDDMLALRATVIEASTALIDGFSGSDASSIDPALVNLAHYLCLRHHDIRPLQRRLMRFGLSSLGRLESRVLPTLDAVIVALASLAGRQGPVAMPQEDEFFRGEARLEEASAARFGRPPGNPRPRIMVARASEAAGGPAVILDLAPRGMDVARINCAHDGPEAWPAMAGFARAPGAA
ncbi:MAG: pyruvate kinase, partial [Rhizobium sp.]|nr:pyruvate kinase [Rhizobium sp.]